MRKNKTVKGNIEGVSITSCHLPPFLPFLLACTSANGFWVFKAICLKPVNHFPFISSRNSEAGATTVRRDIPCPDRPEIRVLCPVYPVKFHARTGGIKLEVKGSGLHQLLFTGREPCQPVVKCVCNEKFHLMSYLYLPLTTPRTNS